MYKRRKKKGEGESGRRPVLVREQQRAAAKQKKLPAQVVVHTLTEGAFHWYARLYEAQSHLLLARMYTRESRMALSIELAKLLYQEGMEGFSVAEMQRYVSEGMMQVILWEILCNATPEQLEAFLLRRLLQQSEFRTQVIVPQEEEGEHEQYHTRFTRPADDVSQVRRDRRGLPDDSRPFTRRAASRTSRPLTRRASRGDPDAV